MKGAVLEVEEVGFAERSSVKFQDDEVGARGDVADGLAGWILTEQGRGEKERGEEERARGRHVA
jgi:hypothetical protein